MKNHKEIVEILLNNKEIAIGIQDEQNRTALHYGKYSFNINQEFKYLNIQMQASRFVLKTNLKIFFSFLYSGVKWKHRNCKASVK